MSGPRAQDRGFDAGGYVAPDEPGFQDRADEARGVLAETVGVDVGASGWFAGCAANRRPGAYGVIG